MNHLLPFKEYLTHFGTLTNSELLSLDFPPHGYHQILENNLDISFFLMGGEGSRVFCSTSFLPDFLNFFNLSYADFELVYNLYSEAYLNHCLIDCPILIKDHKQGLSDGIYTVPFSNFNKQDSKTVSKCFIRLIFKHVTVNEPLLTIHINFPISPEYELSFKIEKYQSKAVRYLVSNVTKKSNNRNKKYTEVDKSAIGELFNKIAQQRCLDILKKELSYSKKDVKFDKESLQQYVDLIGMIKYG